MGRSSNGRQSMTQKPMIEMHDAVNRFVNAATPLQEAYERLVVEWSPEAPPPNIVFSTFGDSLCEHASSIAESTMTEIWIAAEDLLVHGDESVRNAVATGMLEAMVAKSSSGRFDMSTIARFVGPEAKAYCKA